MQYGYTIIYVADVAATLDFYARAFGLTHRFLHEGGDYGELATGATVLAFSRHSLAETLFDGGYTPVDPAQQPPGIELGLVSDDVPAAYARAVNAGAMPLKAPIEKPWGQVVGYVRDLNGVLIEICSPLG